MRNRFGGCVHTLFRSACLIVALAALTTVTEAQVATGGQAALSSPHRLAGIMYKRSSS